MPLAQHNKRAKDFGVWLYGRTSERKYSGGVRERTGHSILQLSEDIGDTIIVLLDAKLPGPALTLARPLFEGYIRGFWLLKYASDKQVDEFINGRCPNIRDLLVAIPKDAESGGAWIHACSDKNLIAFHDLTHGGSEHVKRRSGDDSVEPNYPEQELESLIKLGNEIRIAIGVELLSRLNDEKTIEELHKWAQALRTEL